MLFIVPEDRDHDEQRDRHRGARAERLLHGERRHPVAAADLPARARA